MTMASWRDSAFRGNLSNDIREICDRLRDSIRTDLQRQLNEKKDSRADIWKEHLTLQDVGAARLNRIG
ncbi:unnamed protein product [Symbiodinium sp. CCMP2592]|nr:unnamed protein product [Symbiodinium sp. CCMP2592]